MRKPSKEQLSFEEARKKNIRLRFEYTSRVVLPWLKKKTQEYKDRVGEYLCGYTLLPQYYTDKRDKEIAAFAALYTGEGEKTPMMVEAMRNLITDAPWEWFRNRGFIELGKGDAMNKRLCDRFGPLYLSISQMFSYLYIATESYFSLSGEKATLEDFFRYRCHNNPSAVMQEISGILKCAKGIKDYEIRWLRVALEDIWGENSIISRHKCLCPRKKEINDFLKIFLPDYKSYGTFDESVALFGFDSPIDFFYAFLAFKELSEEQPKACSRLASAYARWYKEGYEFHVSHYELFLPK